MSTALFPEGLTRTAWDDLQYRCKQYDETDFEQRFTMADPADKQVIRVADLIAIGAMRHIADPENYEGQSLPGWTIWGRKKYANHIPAHVEQQKALLRWAVGQGFTINIKVLGAEVGFPEGSVEFESLAFRDPDGKSAPSDATQLTGWTLYTRNVFHGVTVDNGTTKGVRLDGQPAGDVTSNPSGAPDSDLVLRIPAPSPAPQPPAVKVGDRVLLRVTHPESLANGALVEATVIEVSPKGYLRTKENGWIDSSLVVDVLPPRATSRPILAPNQDEMTSHA
jgi:hypothetical protein